MSGKERERLKVSARVKRGELNLKEAAELLEVSYRIVATISTAAVLSKGTTFIG